MIREFGDVDVLKYGDLETPRPRPGHILIKVLAAGTHTPQMSHFLSITDPTSSPSQRESIWKNQNSAVSSGVLLYFSP